jgi:hypothetical protein
MKIFEVLLFEAYFDDLKVAVLDRLAQFVGSDKNEISTEEFRDALASDGFLMSAEELVKALEQMDVVQSATVDTITPKGKIPNDMVDPEQELDQVDVGAMAGDQAMSAVKDDLPQ